ncbi:MAG: aldolase/citrate lyase family protein [Actinomycetota bacterium]|nr:aldolase/citrate lyase family protein [Actinomycetota bacterium]
MRARRSCLSVPARPSRKLEKAASLEPDEIVIDLEDSVPTALKAEARNAVADPLARGEFAAASVSVRVNGVGTPWFEDDLRAVANAGERLASVIVPKVESRGDLASAEALLAEAGRNRPIRLQALIESAKGLRDVNEIATSGGALEASTVR